MSATLASPHVCKDVPDCLACEKDFRSLKRQAFRWTSYTGPLTKGQANGIISAHVKSITDDYAQICGDVDTRGDGIMNRWRKLDKASRRTAIVNALPNLPEKKWAHLNAYFQLRSSNAFDTRDQHRQTFLLPSFNIEDLVTDPSRLLILLDLRRTHRPSEWAWVDFESTNFGRESGMLAMRIAKTYYSTDDTTYGNSLPYNELQFHTWETIGFATAEILFEAQRDLYRLLAGVVRFVLARDASAHGNTLWTRRAKTSFSELVPAAQRRIDSSLCVPLQPFKSPESYDLDEISDLAQERLRSAEAELRAYQSDPFSANEAVSAIRGSQYFSSMSSEEQWPAVALELTVPLQTRTRIWSTMVLWTDMIREVEDDPTLLEDDLEDILGYVIDKIDQLWTSDLRDHITNSLIKDNAFDQCFGPPSGRKSVAQWRKDRVTSQKKRQHEERTTQANFSDNILLWAVTELSLYTRAEAIYRPLKDVLLVLEDWLSVPQNTLPAGSRVPELLEDVSVIFWIQNSLSTHRPEPGRRPRQITASDSFQMLRSGFVGNLTDKIRDKRIRSDGAVYKTNMAGFYLGVNATNPDERITKAGGILKAFFAIKLSKRKRTKTTPTTLPWLDNVIASKTALNDVWEEVRNIDLAALSELTKMSETEIESWNEIKVLEYYKDEEYLSSKQEERYELAMKKADAAALAQATQNLALAQERERVDLARWQATDTSSFPQKVGPEPTDTSPKRKRVIEVEVPARPPPAIRQAQQTILKAADRITVSSEAIATFARLWPNQSRIEEAGSVTFQDFLNAMDSAGCVGGSNKGSKWYFQKPGLSRIRIDAPHGKLNAVIKRYHLFEHGRYLQARWKWQWATFVEQGTVAEDVLVW